MTMEQPLTDLASKRGGGGSLLLRGLLVLSLIIVATLFAAELALRVIDVGGPDLAGSLTDLGLIDEYCLYFRPFVLGRGKPYFASARPPLRLVATDPVGEDAVRLTYAPA